MTRPSIGLWMALAAAIVISLILTFPQILLYAALSVLWPLDLRNRPLFWLLCMGIFCIGYVYFLFIVGHGLARPSAYKHIIALVVMYTVVGAFWMSMNVLTKRPL